MSTDHEPFAFPIERGLVTAFNRALGEFSECEFAPPTYVTAADQFDPDFTRRPQPGRQWLEEPLESLFHVEQTIRYFAPLRLGAVCTAARKKGRRWHKQGRSAGKLEFIETITDVRDEKGKLLLESSWVDVRTERGHQSVTVAQGGRDRHAQADASHLARKTNAPYTQAVSRTMIAMYIGAAGDFHPLHHDDAYAKEQGYPSVFAPGMLTMALNARTITKKVSQQDIVALGGRFIAQVWPGDILTTELGEADDDPFRLTAKTRNHQGAIVYDGWAQTSQQVQTLTSISRQG